VTRPLPTPPRAPDGARNPLGGHRHPRALHGIAVYAHARLSAQTSPSPSSRVLDLPDGAGSRRPATRSNAPSCCPDPIRPRALVSPAFRAHGMARDALRLLNDLLHHETRAALIVSGSPRTPTRRASAEPHRYRPLAPRDTTRVAGERQSGSSASPAPAPVPRVAPRAEYVPPKRLPARPFRRRRPRPRRARSGSCCSARLRPPVTRKSRRLAGSRARPRGKTTYERSTCSPRRRVVPTIPPDHVPRRSTAHGRRDRSSSPEYTPYRCRKARVITRASPAAPASGDAPSATRTASKLEPDRSCPRSTRNGPSPTRADKANRALPPFALAACATTAPPRSGLGASIVDRRARSIRACADIAWLTLASARDEARANTIVTDPLTTSLFPAGWVPRAGTITVAAQGDLAMPGLTPHGGHGPRRLERWHRSGNKGGKGLTMYRLAMHVIEREAATCGPADKRSRCAPLPQSRLYRPDAAYTREPNTFPYPPRAQ